MMVEKFKQWRANQDAKKRLRQHQKETGWDEVFMWIAFFFLWLPLLTIEKVESRGKNRSNTR